jgi:hypothetical protein
VSELTVCRPALVERDLPPSRRVRGKRGTPFVAGAVDQRGSSFCRTSGSPTRVVLNRAFAMAVVSVSAEVEAAGSQWRVIANLANLPTIGTEL